jgi:hypothetical protein
MDSKKKRAPKSPPTPREVRMLTPEEQEALREANIKAHKRITELIKAEDAKK